MNVLNPALQIKHEAAKCVACGLCLPHCPTYDLLRDESESPRGRLSLMLALAKNELSLNAKLESHLARCLACRACEKVCPSDVAYGQVLDSTRALIGASSTSQRTPTIIKILHWFVEDRRRLQLLGHVLYFFQFLRISRLLKYFGLAELQQNITTLLPQKSFQEIYPVKVPTPKRVFLFIGCLASITDRLTLNASIRLLNRLGYEVQVPPVQTCCGALHLHQGELKKSFALMQQNIQAFAGVREAILCTASGCTATLVEYSKFVTRDNNPSSQKFSNRVMDVNQFLVDVLLSKDFSFKPLAKRIAVHDPCTLTNVLRQEKNPYALLARIPGAEIVPLPGNNRCCGAAGTYHLTEVQIAQQLRAVKIAHLKKIAPDILVTSNPGCAMYLTAGLHKAGLSIEVIHPIVLLERQLQETPVEPSLS